jgi:GNAT superfamily N-acetyltransferase
MSRDAGRDLTIRPATAGDAGVLLALVRELAVYERAPDAVVATEASFAAHISGDRPAFHALLAERGGEAIGFALYYFGFSTWRGTPVLYLEDLFVRPAARQQGVGKALMGALAGLAVDRGCHRFVWQVLDWNAPAIAFYEALGATVLREWLTVRVDGEALAALARRRDG